MEVLDFLWILSYFILALSIFYKYLTWNFSYFLEQGIIGPLPIPFFGNSWNIWNKSWDQIEIQRYKKFGRIYGTFEGRTPCFTIGDPKIYEKILVKDSEKFRGRRSEIIPFRSYKKNLLELLRGKKWITLRENMDPIFAKINVEKASIHLENCGKDLVQVLETKLKSGVKKLDVKEVLNAYVLDGILICAFGTKQNVQLSPDSTISRLVGSLYPKEAYSWKFYLTNALYPRLKKFFPDSSLNELDFIADYAKQKLKERKFQFPKNENEAKDFLDIFLENPKMKANDNLISSQMIQFLNSGYDPVRSTLASGINQLALNEDVQNKLRDELKQISGKNFNLESIRNLEYLDACVCEILRTVGPTVKLERCCSSSADYGKIKIFEGSLVSIPVYAIHHDPEIFPSPEIFNPSRFSPEEKSRRDPLSFFPFGKGERDCIGSNFAINQIKVGLAFLIHNFRFYRIFETSDPLHFIPGGFPPVLSPVSVIVGIEAIKN